MSSDWTFRRRHGSCAACGREFAGGEALFSLLRFAAGLLERGDLCCACFERRDESEEVFYWRTVQRARRDGLRIDFEVVLAALLGLREDERPERRDFCFLLALLLVRHRRLRLAGVQRRGRSEFLLLRKPRARVPFEVEVRELDEERRARLSEVLAGLLDPARDGGVEALLDEGKVALEANPAD